MKYLLEHTDAENFKVQLGACSIQLPIYIEKQYNFNKKGIL